MTKIKAIDVKPWDLLEDENGDYMGVRSVRLEAVHEPPANPTLCVLLEDRAGSVHRTGPDHEWVLVASYFDCFPEGHKLLWERASQ